MGREGPSVAPTHANGGPTRRAAEALLVWVAFIVVNVVISGTIPFALGTNMSRWAQSDAHFALSGFFVYGVLFLVVPLVLEKGWQTVRRPAFLVPLLAAVVAAGLWDLMRGIGVFIIIVLLYLHWRFDLSVFGFRSDGLAGDAVAVLLVAALYTAPRLLRPITGIDLPHGLQAGLFRLFGNPATSAEYFFYFGFLATRLSGRLRPLLVAPLVGVMYTAHEMVNPEYWYEGMQFAFALVGVTLATAIYLWRRSLYPMWLGDGVSRFLQAFLA